MLSKLVFVSRATAAAAFLIVSSAAFAQIPKAATPAPLKPAPPLPAGTAKADNAPGGPLAAQPSTPIAFAYTPSKRSDGRHVVAIDIGHTAVQHGSTSARGEGEFSFNQRIVRQLKARLDRSAVVFPVVINPEGGKIGLLDRPRIAAQQGAELFLSIHHDAANDKYLQKWDPNGDGKIQEYSDQFRGYGVFVSKKNRQFEESNRFGLALGAAMKARGFVFTRHHNEPIPGENRPILDAVHGVYQYDDLIVLKHSPMPAALLECGVIINREEELELKKAETQARLVEAAATAVEGFFAASR